MEIEKITLPERFRVLLTGKRKTYTLAELMPPWYGGQPVWTDWTTENAIQNGMKVCGYVYACVYRLMKSAASVPWLVKVKKGEDWEVAPDHPAAQLIAKPNPFMSGQDLIERVTAYLYLAGNAILGKVRARGVVAELWPYYPDRIKPIMDKLEFIKVYKYTDAGIIKYIEAKDIIHWMFTDPANVYWGMSPMQAAGRMVDIEVEMSKWNKIAMQNRAVSDGVFSFKDSLTPKQWAEARTQIREQHQGSATARTPWVLSGGATWQAMSLTPAEMDFIESKKLNREDICSVFGMPPPMICFYDNATLANIETARKILWLDTVIPYLDDLKSGFNLALAPDFGPDVRIVYDLSNVEAIREKYQEKVETGERLFAMGVPLNDINRKLELGFDDYPWGDIGYISARVYPVGSIGEELPKGKQKELPEPKEDFKGFNLQTEDQKTQFWKVFDRARLGWEKVIEGQASKLLGEESKIFADAYMKLNGDMKKFEKIIDSRISKWSETLNAAYGEILADFGENTYNDLLKSFSDFAKKTAKGQKDFDPFNSLIIAWSKKWSAERATLIAESSKNFCKGIITLGLEDAKTTYEISKDLRKYYDQNKIYRAYRMGRTEVAGASNYGSLAGAKQADIPKMKKCWVSARDDRVRDSHIDVEGNYPNGIEMDDFFYVNGYPMAYPGDPSGPGDETIMCRCALSYKTG